MAVFYRIRNEPVTCRDPPATAADLTEPNVEFDARSPPESHFLLSREPLDQPDWQSVDASRERRMSLANRDSEHDLRQRAYELWEREGRPDGRAEQHWHRAMVESRQVGTHTEDGMLDEEKVLEGWSTANIPAMLTQDVPGG
jgi:hypothetical protein